MSVLSIWTIYDHPKDYPTEYVARRHEIFPGATQVTDDIVRAQSLTALREEMAMRGLTCITRCLGDDPVIVESWL